MRRFRLFDFVFFTAETPRARRKVAFLFPLRGRKKKKINRYAIFFYYKCPQGLLLIVFRPLNEKQ